MRSFMLTSSSSPTFNTFGAIARRTRRSSSFSPSRRFARKFSSSIVGESNRLKGSIGMASHSYTLNSWKTPLLVILARWKASRSSCSSAGSSRSAYSQLPASGFSLAISILSCFAILLYHSLSDDLVLIGKSFEAFSDGCDNRHTDSVTCHLV